MKPLHYEALCEMLLERFGAPIGDNEAPPTSPKKKDMGNRGFGSDDLDECGEMHTEMPMDESDDDTSRAEEVINHNADADMSAREMLELLIQNGIPREVAVHVVQGVRGNIEESKAKRRS